MNNADRDSLVDRKCCFTCRHWDSSTECHRRAPVAIPNMAEGEADPTAFWPETAAWWECGDWQADSEYIKRQDSLDTDRSSDCVETSENEANAS